jgi:hypothetical protein
MLLIPDTIMSLKCSPHFFCPLVGRFMPRIRDCQYPFTHFVHHSFAPNLRKRFTRVIAIRQAFLSSLQYERELGKVSQEYETWVIKNSFLPEAKARSRLGERILPDDR